MDQKKKLQQAIFDLNHRTKQKLIENQGIEDDSFIETKSQLIDEFMIENYELLLKLKNKRGN